MLVAFVPNLVFNGIKVPVYVYVLLFLLFSNYFLNGAVELVILLSDHPMYGIFFADFQKNR